MDCRFNRTREQATANASHPCHKGTLVCGEELSISFLKKKKLKMHQSWGVGFSILEISKLIMQKLYYDEIIPNLGEGNVSIVMSDTDSFLLEVKGWTEDDIMRKLAHVMDFSNLDKTHPLYDASRSKVPGYLKNEVPKNIIEESVALKSKTNAIRFRAVKRSKNTAKGVKRSVKDNIPFDKFLACLDGIKEMQVEQNCIRSKNHVNHMLRSKKVAFSSFDDKRFLLCPKHSAPYGSALARKKRPHPTTSSSRGKLSYLARGRPGCYFCQFPKKLY